MCARRFLFIIFILTLLFVAGAVAIFQWGGDVLLRQATPQGPFRAPAARSGPDYDRVESWIAHPALPRAENPALWMPSGAEPVRPETTNAAVFYVHPTTYLQRDRWNAPLSQSADAEFRTRMFVRTQASAFSAAGEVWAPRYRQAAFGAFLLDSEDAKRALDLAYRDVLGAFDQFLRSVPAGKPVILAGHSQGALHLSRLLVDRRSALSGRLVAAYVVGWPVSDAADLRAMGLRACTRPQETGCLLSWLTFADPANPDLILDNWLGTEGPSGVRRERRDILCVNPITGTRGAEADAAMNPGTLLPVADLSSASLEPGLVGAECRSGFLYLQGEVPAVRAYVLPGNNYHVYDYALFWGAIRRDAERRAAAWRR